MKLLFFLIKPKHNVKARKKDYGNNLSPYNYFEKTELIKLL